MAHKVVSRRCCILSSRSFYKGKKNNVELNERRKEKVLCSREEHTSCNSFLVELNIAMFSVTARKLTLNRLRAQYNAVHAEKSEYSRARAYIKEERVSSVFKTLNKKYDMFSLTYAKQRSERDANARQK